MEGVEVCRSPCRSPCSIAENNPLPCESKSHAARRRRMEIQKFKGLREMSRAGVGQDPATNEASTSRNEQEAGLSAFPLTSEAKLQDVLSNEVVLKENRTAVVI